MPALRSLTFLIFSFFLFGNAANACEACVTRSTMEQTVKQSDVIVLVSNDDRNSGGIMGQRPDVLELTVVKVFKGRVDTSTILVRSWYGECAYGVQMRMGTKAMLFLQQVTDVANGEVDGTYKLVEDGCSEGQLQVMGDTIRVNDKWTSFSSFVSNYVN